MTTIVLIALTMLFASMGVGYLLGKVTAKPPEPITKIEYKDRVVPGKPLPKDNQIVLGATKGAKGRYRLIGWLGEEHGTTLFTGGPSGVATEEEAEGAAFLVMDSDFRLAKPFVQPTKKELERMKREAEQEKTGD